MPQLKRGEIYYIHFPYTLDKKYPNGKNKFVLVLQEGDYFKDSDTVACLLITSDAENAIKYELTDVEIPLGMTKLKDKSSVDCSQPYTLPKELFQRKGVWCAGSLTTPKLDEVDEALYFGLCMDKQNDKKVEKAVNE